MKCITRERPKIDRIACPWLIKNFVNKDAVLIYVPKELVFENAKELEAIPYDIPGAEYSHYGAGRTFDFIIKKQNIVAVAMITPGPVVITVGFIGYLIAGFPGAATAAWLHFYPVIYLLLFMRHILKR